MPDSKPVRVAYMAELIRQMPPRLAVQLRDNFATAEAKLDDAMEILECTANDAVADALQWLRDDMKALRRAAQDAVLT